jgi:hypothetical protein
MEPSPPRSPGSLLSGLSLLPFGVPYTRRSQVDLGRLAGPLEGITPFMVAGPRITPATEEQERGSPAMEPLTRSRADLMISDWPATPYHREDPPSPTADMINPNPNGLGSGSPPQISPLGNRVIRLPPQPKPDRPPATRASSPMHVLRTRQCDESSSTTRNQMKGRRWGEEDGGPLTRVARAAEAVGGPRWVS